VGAGLDLPQHQPTQSNQVEWLIFHDQQKKKKQIREMFFFRLQLDSLISYFAYSVSNVNENIKENLPLPEELPLGYILDPWFWYGIGAGKSVVALNVHRPSVAGGSAI
jgi:hypothetical protein